MENNSPTFQQLQYERELLYHLTKITFEGGTSNSLIITQGPVYIQFIAEQGCHEMMVEAISNQYLPQDRHLGDAAITELGELGFDIPNNAGGNFQRICDVSRPEYFHQLAHFVISIFINVYHCNLEKGFEFEFHFD